MKKSLLAATVAIVALGTFGGATSALATDWTGWYAGLNVGVATSNTGWDNLVNPSLPGAGLPGQKVFSVTRSGFTGGGQVGYNDQMGIWVLGVEAGINATDEGSSVTCLGGYQDYHATCSTRSAWNGDIALRAGGTVGPALLYVKAGGAFGDLNSKALNVNDGGSTLGGYMPSSSTPFGFLFGIGAELAFTDDVSGAIEYNYTSLSGTANMVPVSGSDTEIVLPFHVHVTQDASVVVAKLNFKL